MPTKSLSDLLSSYGACSEACAWAEGRLVDEESYHACPRGDWLLCILARLGLQRPLLVLASCACARTALKYVPADEPRPRIAIETAEAWARGGEGAPTPEQVRAAAGDAYVYAAAADAADAAHAAEATHAAAYAAVALAAANARVAARAAARAAAAAYAAAVDARTQALAECADIVRGVVPWEVVANLATRAP